MALDQESVGSGGDVLDALVRKGIDLCRNGKLESGLPYLTFVRGAPSSPAELPSVFYSWLGYGMACLEGGRYVEGLELCQRAVGAGPGEEDNYLNLSRAYLLLHRVESARETVEKGLEACPGSVVLEELEREVADAVETGGDTGFLVSKRRLARRAVAAEEKARKLAMELWSERQEHYQHRNHDELTGLMNRPAFLRAAQPTLDFAARSGRATALFYIGVDDFRVVNETVGVAKGDEVLAAVGRAIGRAAGGLELVARVGGDSFAVVIHDVEDEAEIARRASALISMISELVLPGETVGSLQTSIGISVCPRDARDASTLLVRAESAVRRAKDLGGNRCRFFSQPLPKWAPKTLSIENRLKRAMEQDELCVYFQPIRDAQSRRLVGTEALVRWLDPDRGHIPPARFIPVAEETGLILPLGEWILRAALTQWKAWLEAGLLDFALSVNFSARQLRYPKQVQRVAEVLRELGVAPSLLRVEITESSILQDTSTTVSSLEVLTRMGIRLSLDDFGTGYSSFRMLRRIPFSHVKIGDCFVRDIGTGRDGSVLPEAIIAMAHRLGQKVVAEGVETNDQLEHLLAHDCDELQGRLLGKELPAEDFEALLRDEQVMEGTLEPGIEFSEMVPAVAGGS